MIKVQDVAYAVGGIDVIKGVSFSTKKNEFISIIGPSGCGKSTLLRMMIGLVSPTSGRVLFMNREITAPRKEISFVFQDFGLLPWLTNIENVKIGLSYFEISDEEKDRTAKDLLARFGLEGFEDSYPNVLSGGMRQRVGIARAIASEPLVLLMDEPFSSLDELTANTLRSDILSMVRNTAIPVNSVIMVTHNVEEAVELSNKIVILSGKPTSVKEVMEVDMDYPRNRRSRKFQGMVDHVYRILTG
ncbi:MAG: ABC transporter ATP-binding protein [Candidatus Micrarchaeota archaeon]|nr:ABC transporter ATP-binding protein [Candidatus Micrarchaeota archaeon]